MSRERDMGGLTLNRRTALISVPAASGLAALRPWTAFAQEGPPSQSKEKNISRIPVEAFPGRIIFDSEKEGNSEIYISRLDGTDLRRLTNHPASDIRPVWTKDDSGRIVFISNRDGSEENMYNFFLLNPKNGEIEQLTNFTDRYVYWYATTPSGVVFLYYDSSNKFFFGEIDLKTKINKNLGGLTGTWGDLGLDNDYRIFIPDKYADVNTNGVEFFFGENRSRSGGQILLVKNAPKSPDGKWYAISFKEGRTYSLFKVQHEDGNERARMKLVDNFHFIEPKTWSSGGKWVMFKGVEKTGNKAHLYIVSASGSSIAIKLPMELEQPGRTRQKEPEPNKEKELKIWPEERKRIILVPGVTSEVEEGGMGWSKVFKQTVLEVRKYGYTAPDVLFFSTTGGKVNKENGLWYPNSQTCKDSLESPEKQGEVLADMIVEWLTLHPNDTLHLISHSNGFWTVFHAMEILKQRIEKDPNYLVKPAKLRFTFTHAPALGVDKPSLEKIGALLPIGCKIGPFPAPNIANKPAGKNLLKAWDQREVTRNRIEKTMNWWTSRSSRAMAIGNTDDMVISTRETIFSEIFEFIPSYNYEPEIIYTQEVPGAENHMLSLGKAGLGHDRVLKTEEGLSLLLQFIGEQKKENQHRAPQKAN